MMATLMDSPEIVKDSENDKTPDNVKDIKSPPSDIMNFLQLSDDENTEETESTKSNDSHPQSSKGSGGGDFDCAFWFLEFLEDNGHKIVRSGRNFYWYNPDKGIWSAELKYELRKYINKCDYIDEKYNQSVKKQDNLIIALQSLVENDPNFLKAPNTQKKIPFNNGIWDFEQAKLVDFSPDYRFFYKLKYDYNPTPEITALIKEIYEKIFISIFKKEKGDFMLDCLSRALSGSSSDKQFNVVIGDGNSGKGVISDLLSNSLGIFTATTNASNFSVDKFGGGDKAKKKSWIAAIKDCRIAICNEVEMGHALDGNIIKSISGGDEQQVRQNGQDEFAFSPEFITFIFVNDMPEIKPTSKEITNRMRYIGTEYQYLDEPLYSEMIAEGATNIRRPDPNLKDKWLKRPFAHMLVQNYKNAKPTPPAAVLQESKEWLSGDDTDNLLRGLFLRTKNEEDYSTCKALYKKVQEAKINISNTKMGKMMKKMQIKKKTKSINGKTADCYLGIKLLDLHANDVEDENVFHEDDML
jgi:hypothetical protein